MTALHSQLYKNAIERVIQRRLALGWSQEELARRLPRYEKPSAPGEASGAHQLQSYVSKFEQCHRRLDVTEFEHICHALGMTVAEAIEEHKWNGDPPPSFVPRANETEEEEPHQRRVKPGRKRRVQTVSEAGDEAGPPLAGPDQELRAGPDQEPAAGRDAPLPADGPDSSQSSQPTPRLRPAQC